MLPRRLLGSLAGLLLPVALAAQADAALLRRVDSVFAPWSRTDTPGCAVGADKDGMPLFRRAYGMANLETGTPWTVGTISESGSVAKQFVAGAIVLAARDGLFTLDDDITRWIPEAKGFGKKITIRQLLSHTSGIPDRYTLHEVMGRPAGETDHDNAEVMAVVARLKELNFDPGEDYEYSNTGLIVAATLLERATHQSLEAFTHARIFQPLGMTDTRWRADHRVVVPGRASAYSGTQATGFRNDHPFTRVIGSGGLLTTVSDWLKWEAALQKGEGAWGAVRDSLERGTRLNDGTVLTYGLGVGVSSARGVRVISHTGSTGGYRAALSRYPQQNLAIALLCNLGSINPGAVQQAVARLLLGSALAAAPAEPQPAPVDREALGALAGAWHAARTEEPLVLSLLPDGRLGDSVARLTLIPLSPTKYQYRGSERTLTLLPGTPARLLLEQPSARAVEYQKMDRMPPSAVTLAGYAGSYRSAELDATVQLTLSGDTLKLATVQTWQDPIPLRPLYVDGFYAGGAGELRFERDKKGKVSGFVLWAGRVRHLRFVREK